MELRYKIRISLGFLLATVLAWLFYMAIVPGGRISYYTDFRHNNFFLGQITPKERAVLGQDGFAINGEPVYFSLRTLRRFDRARLTIEYENHSNSSLIEAGVLTDKQVWNYDLKPIENLTLEGLNGRWNKLKDGDLALYQKIPVYKSVAEFLNNPPEPHKIAVYNYDYEPLSKISGYAPSTDIYKINIPLRGAFQFYTYIKNEPLDFNFVFDDLNRNTDRDPITVNLYNSKEEALKSAELEDDGIMSDSGPETFGRKLTISALNLPEGFYKVEVKCNDDIIMEQMETTQKKISFINKIWVADGIFAMPEIYTDSYIVSAETVNPAKLQTILIDGQPLAVSETYKQFGARTKNQIAKIVSSHNDIILAGDGVFSFMEDNLADPSVRKMDANTDLDRENISYVLADYVAPRKAGESRIQTANFDLAKAYRENGKYSFLISIPRLGTPGNGGNIIIKNIKVELTGKTLKEFMRQK